MSAWSADRCSWGCSRVLLMINYFFVAALISELARWTILCNDDYTSQSAWKSASLIILFVGWVLIGHNIVN